jgi:hypothetical protein
VLIPQSRHGLSCVRLHSFSGVDGSCVDRQDISQWAGARDIALVRGA